jgi:hypothetical protein
LPPHRRVGNTHEVRVGRKKQELFAALGE